ncbi:hypothetical protein TNCV_4459951 [Trichonephila clavipes]|nr:hypothetical protein TNCV_4459951 [Trichonephila clavipes]
MAEFAVEKVFCVLEFRKNIRAVGSLVVRALDSRPEDLGSMPDATKYPRVHTEYVLVKSVDPKVLRAESRVQGDWRIFSLPFSSISKLWRWR